MDDFASRESLYRDTLDTASAELQDLSREIRRVRGLLEQLEQRRKAVTQLCEALTAWLDLAEQDDAADPDAEDAGSEPHPHGLRLTEEEVSLIAYPGARQRSA